jgi:enediyne biosynthesis protein E4
VTRKAGVTGSGYGMGVATGDYDNDGWPDLFLPSLTQNQLFHNNGDGTFTDVTDKAGLGGPTLAGMKMWSTSAGWLDYNNDGLLDLFVANYVRWDRGHDTVCLNGRGVRDYCRPENFAPLPNTLYRNNGDGTFTDVSAETRIANQYGRGMGIAFADYDLDGFMDIFVANDSGPNLLFHNITGKKFEEVAFDAGVAYDEHGQELAGMGADFRDVNNDGLPDIWYTALQTQTFPLLLNRGGGQFMNVTEQSRIGQLSSKMTGWSNGIVDLDNDGWKDLFVARGNLLRERNDVSDRPIFAEPNALFRNVRDGHFEDVSSTAGKDFQFASAHRGVAFGDIDNDGRIDAVVTSLGGKLELLHNVTESHNHWITLQLIGKKSNRMGIGAQVRIKGEDGLEQYNEATTCYGYGSSSDVRVHFGLGASRIVREIQVWWPGGSRQTLRDVVADRILNVEELAP